MKEYTEADLVSFGAYMVSRQRTKMILEHPGTRDEQKLETIRTVTDADIQNWKEVMKNIPFQ